MPLTELQKTDITTKLTRLKVKYVEINTTRNELRRIIACAKAIIDDNSIDSDTDMVITDTRREALRLHVVGKADMLVPDDPPSQ